MQHKELNALCETYSAPILFGLKDSIAFNLTTFENLFKSHYSELCAYANSFLNDIEAAEETVQALFVKLWENRSSVGFDRSPRAYLYSATKNACFNQLRHLKVKEAYKIHNQEEMEHSQFNIEDDLQAQELEIKIRKAIDRLPEGRRKIFILSRFEGKKYKEIAEQLKISIKTVENQMGSALKLLKEDLAEYLTIFFIMMMT
ncbi:RNA polymerase sigma-70 factor [Crocinitomix algicola]|uniref:RNA polymerase sigma-70 factor n=1 Tax=Crocinitomix algicola TaxID=1740263 RepID=UPI001586114E|nr:RNA polymerase sigma-70 factor [Crocinitomix algicola]